MSDTIYAATPYMRSDFPQALQFRTVSTREEFDKLLTEIGDTLSQDLKLPGGAELSHTIKWLPQIDSFGVNHTYKRALL